MLKRLLFFLPALIIAAPSIAATQPSFGSTGNGAGACQSASYKNTVALGTVAGDSANANYRNFPGFLSAAMTVVDDHIIFLSPSPTEPQNSRNVTARITVQKDSGVTISTVAYRISNSGPVFSGLWLGDASVESVSNDGNTIRYKAVIPDYFTVSNNNYIRWRVNYSTYSAFSDAYRITVAEDHQPIVVLQPDAKGARAGTQPVIQARIIGGADLATLRVRLLDDQGSAVLTLTGVANPSIYNAATETVYYKYEGAPLAPGRTYTLEIYDGSKGTVTVAFVVQGGAIADLVPYPSPFDPKVRPVTIRYVLNERADVTMNIYDMGGRLVKNIVNNEPRSAGVVEEQWNATNYGGDELANGVYICELVAKDSSGEHRRYTSLAVLGK